MKFTYDKTPPTLLVTGSKGRLGQAALPELKKHFAVMATDKAPPSVGDQRYLQADISRFDEVKSLCEGVEAVVHLAIASIREFGPNAESKIELEVEQANAFDESTILVNVNGTRNIFESARLAGVKKIVYLSSMTAYLGDYDRVSFGKDTPFNPKSLYACTKIFGENLAQLYSRLYGISIIVLRLGQPYPSDTYLDGIWQTNRKARSLFVTLEDTVQAILCALKTDIQFGTYNVVSASDNPRVDLSPAREIGYMPRAYFSAAGLSYLYDAQDPAIRPEMYSAVSDYQITK